MDDESSADTWIAFFHRQPVHAWLCEVDVSFIGASGACRVDCLQHACARQL